MSEKPPRRSSHAKVAGLEEGQASGFRLGQCEACERLQLDAHTPAFPAHCTYLTRHRLTAIQHGEVRNSRDSTDSDRSICFQMLALAPTQSRSTPMLCSSFALTHQPMSLHDKPLDLCATPPVYSVQAFSIAKAPSAFSCAFVTVLSTKLVDLVALSKPWLVLSHFDSARPIQQSRPPPPATLSASSANLAHKPLPLQSFQTTCCGR